MVPSAGCDSPSHLRPTATTPACTRRRRRVALRFWCRVIRDVGSSPLSVVFARSARGHSVRVFSRWRASDVLSNGRGHDLFAVQVNEVALLWQQRAVVALANEFAHSFLALGGSNISETPP